MPACWEAGQPPHPYLPTYFLMALWVLLLSLILRVQELGQPNEPSEGAQPVPNLADPFTVVISNLPLWQHSPLSSIQHSAADKKSIPLVTLITSHPSRDCWHPFHSWIFHQLLSLAFKTFYSLMCPWSIYPHILTFPACDFWCSSSTTLSHLKVPATSDTTPLSPLLSLMPGSTSYNTSMMASLFSLRNPSSNATFSVRPSAQLLSTLTTI